MSLLSRRDALAGGFAFAAAGALVPVFWRGGASPVSLVARKRAIDVRGKAATVFGLEGPSGFHGLAFNKGERFRVRLENALDVPTLVHWHGQTPPSDQDGVPDLSQPTLPPGGSYHYDFENPRVGTFWMHSHVALQEQVMLAAPLIVRDPDSEPADVQEHVVLIHDFTFRDPDEIMAELRSGHGAHAGHSMSGMDMKDMDHSATGRNAMLN